MTVGQNTVSGEQLRSLIERVEQLAGEKKAIGDDMKQVFAEAKANGFSPVIMRNIIKRRQAKPIDVEETDALMNMYMHSLGMLPEAPLFRAVGLMDVDLKARDSVIDALKQLVPEKAEFIVKIGKSPVRMSRVTGGEVVVSDYHEPKPVAPVQSSSSPSSRPAVPVPDCSEDESHELGKRAYLENQPVIANPFPAGDARRALFDQGWRAESGSDGMGEDE